MELRNRETRKIKTKVKIVHPRRHRKKRRYNALPHDRPIRQLSALETDKYLKNIEKNIVPNIWTKIASNQPLKVVNIICTRCTKNHYVIPNSIFDGTIISCEDILEIKTRDYQIPLVFKYATWIEKMMVSVYRVRMSSRQRVSRCRISEMLEVNGPISSYENLNLAEITLPHAITDNHPGEMLLALPSDKNKDRVLYVRSYVVHTMLEYLMKNNPAYLRNLHRIKKDEEALKRLDANGVEAYLISLGKMNMNKPIPIEKWHKFQNTKEGSNLTSKISSHFLQQIMKLNLIDVMQLLLNAGMPKCDTLYLFGYYKDAEIIGIYKGTSKDPYQKYHSHLPNTLTRSALLEECEIRKSNENRILAFMTDEEKQTHNAFNQFLSSEIVNARSYNRKVNDMLNVPDIFSLTFPWLFPHGLDDITNSTSLIHSNSTLTSKINLFTKWSQSLLLSTVARRFSKDASFVFTLYDLRMRMLIRKETAMCYNVIKPRCEIKRSVVTVNHADVRLLSSYMSPSLGMRNMSQVLRRELSNIMLPNKNGPAKFFITLNPREGDWYHNDVDMLEDDGLLQLSFIERARMMISIIAQDLEATDVFNVMEWQKRGQPHIHLLVFNKWTNEKCLEWYISNIVCRTLKEIEPYQKHECYRKGQKLSCIVDTRDKKKEYCRYGFGCKKDNKFGRPIHTKWKWIDTAIGVVPDPPRTLKDRFIWPYNPIWISKWKGNMSIDIITNPLASLDYISSYITKVREDDYWQWTSDAKKNTDNEFRRSELGVVDTLMRCNWASTVSLPQALHHLCELPLSMYRNKYHIDNESNCVNRSSIFPLSSKKRITIFKNRIVRTNTWDRYSKTQIGNNIKNISYEQFIIEESKNRNIELSKNDIMYFLPRDFHRISELLCWFPIITTIPWYKIYELQSDNEFSIELDYNNLPDTNTENRWISYKGIYYKMAILIINTLPSNETIVIRQYIDHIENINRVSTIIPVLRPNISSIKDDYIDEELAPYVDEITVFEEITPIGTIILPYSLYEEVLPISPELQYNIKSYNNHNNMTKHDLSNNLETDQLIVWNTLYEFIHSNDHFIIDLDAPGGTGKSFLIAKIVNRFRYNCKVVAPTHQSANLINGVTIQSMTWEKCIDGTERTISDIDSWFRDIEDIHNIYGTPKIAILIVDEAAFTSGRMIIQLHRLIYNKTLAAKDENRIRVGLLMVGDICQNTPVRAIRYCKFKYDHSKAKRSSSHAELARHKEAIMEELPIKYMSLNLNKRMRIIEPSIAMIISSFRNKEVYIDQLYNAYDNIRKNAFYRDLCPNKIKQEFDWTIICAFNRDVESCNQILVQDNEVYRWLYNRKSDNQAGEVDRTAPIMYAKKGELLIVTEKINTNNIGFINNNTRVRLCCIMKKDEEWIARLTLNNHYFDIKTRTGKLIKIDNKDVVVPVFPFTIANVLTVHRAQGDGYPKLHIIMPNEAHRNRGWAGLFYTALTRCENPSFDNKNISFWPFTFDSLLTHIKLSRKANGFNVSSLEEKNNE